VSSTFAMIVLLNGVSRKRCRWGYTPPRSDWVVLDAFSCYCQLWVCLDVLGVVIFFLALYGLYVWTVHV